MTTREIEAPPAAELGTAAPPRRLARLGRRLHVAAAVAVFKARAWHIQRSLPGIAGIMLVSAAVGGIFGFWYGIGTLGLFCLRVDSRL